MGGGESTAFLIQPPTAQAWTVKDVLRDFNAVWMGPKAGHPVPRPHPLRGIAGGFKAPPRPGFSLAPVLKHQILRA